MVYLAQVGSFHNIICAIEAAKKNGFNTTQDSFIFLVHRKPIYEKWSFVQEILDKNKIKGKVILFETINERTLDRNLIKDKKKELAQSIKKIDILITNFNFGINYSLVKNIFHIDRTILIDDGLINCNKVKNFSLLKYIQYKFIGINKNFYSKYTLGLGKDYDFYYSAIKKKFLKCIESKTLNINVQVHDFYKQIIDHDKSHFDKISSSNSLLLCSNHSVQSNRMNEKDFFNAIKSKVDYMKAHYKIDNLYICMHPAEPKENFNLYSSLGFINLEKYSAEFYLQSNKLSYCLHPCNSVPLVCESINATRTRYISYHLAGAPFKTLAVKINKYFDQETI